ncbi:MAG: rhomboid family intramembrane serine protease [Actinomycetaceae bacterium]|nr:rhomboid family intramembrane serine protease [Actinomycetaceae bacterium]
MQCAHCQIKASAQADTRWRAAADNIPDRALDRRQLDARIGSMNQVGALTQSASVTKTLLITCAAVYLVQFVTRFIASGLLIKWGGFSAILAWYEPWRFISAGFLHSGLWHLIFNMMALYLFGQGLEPLIGHLRFGTIYILSLLGGSLGTIISGYFMVQDLFTMYVGASGAIFGLFGAIFVIQRRVDASNAGLIFLLVINFAFAFIEPNIAWQAHLGGLIAGALTMWIFLLTGSRQRPRKQQRRINWIVAISGFIGLFALSYAMMWLALGLVSFL